MIPKPTKRRTRVDYSWCPLPKTGEVRLNARKYRDLCRRMLARDGFRCRHCGSPMNLTPHHLQRRSRGRMDTMENLVTLCAECHGQADRGEIVV